ncbi:MAG TPA: transglutaminaseTgpA domain-containing protein, partial [Candidatus Limnocylindrales bacterium]
MSAVPADVAPGPILPAWVRRFAVAPAEGWLTLILVVVMAITVAWSIDDAGWVLGNATYGDFFVWAAVFSSLIAFVGAKARWPRWVTHLIGAAAAALIVPLYVGMVLLPNGGTPGELYRATAVSVVNAWTDLALLNLAVTNEIGHYLLVLGLIVWSVGQFATYAVFGHRRPLDAVIVVGMVLLANMALTAHDQLGFLVIFTIASLFLLARSHALDEQSTWVRRRIGDASTVRSLYLRGGTVFIVGAVFASLILTASASSAPLAGAWTGVNDQLIQLSQSLQRYLPFGGAPRQVGFGFGQSTTITGSWTTDGSLAVTIHVPPGDDTPYYWRAVTYDRFEGQAWAWTAPRSIDRNSGAAALADQADDPTALGVRQPVHFTVDPAAMRGPYALSPLDAQSIDQSSKLYVVGTAGYFSALQLGDTGKSYTVNALLPVTVDEPGGRTKNRLRAAGTDYPAEIKALYTQLPADALGVESRKLLDDIRAKSPANNPYDIAATMETELRKFQYNQNITGMCPPGISVVECFARIKQGYCQYYASTMAVFLRDLGIPARMVQGFLPGARDKSTGTETILSSSAHAWVEVYFPGYGWQMFDPTGGGRPQNTAPPEGQVVKPSATPTPAKSVAGDHEVDATRRPTVQGTTAAGPTDTGSGLLIVVAVLLLVGFAALGFIAWQRGPRRDVTPESVWRSIGQTASRFGFGPRANQTVYEYAGALGDVLPGARPQLETVARAKVEVAYGHRELGADRLGALRDAQRRLRLSLLRLA